METESRSAPTPLIARLCAAPAGFSFFQAVRLLEGEPGVGPDSGGPGEGAGEGGHRVRFHTCPSLCFPAGEVRAVEGRAGPGGTRWDLTTDVLGLVGVLGTLPQHYTELVLERLQLRDTTLLDFLDLFQHRTLWFLYRGWRKYRHAFEVEARGECTDTFSQAVLSLAGFGLRETRGRLAVDEGSLAYLAGHLSHRPRSAAGLEGLLGEYFGVPARVESFVGRWLEVSERDRSRLSSGGVAALGSFFVGTRVWDIGSKLRVHFGPVPVDQLPLFLPGQAGHVRLRELVRCYLGPGWDCEVVVEPSPASDLRVRLGVSGQRAELGRNCWLTSERGPVSPAIFALLGVVDT